MTRRQTWMWVCVCATSAALQAASPPVGQIHGTADFDPGSCDATFPDVDAASPLCPWIEQLVADGISEGCGDDGNGGTNFCPDQPVTRGQLARFLERAMRGTTAWDVNADLLDGHDASEFVIAASQSWSSSRRGYYLTNGVFDGSEVLTACEAGFHTATTWELHDPTGVYVPSSAALVLSDAGSGPPTDEPSWVRSGWTSSNTLNCNGWQSAAAQSGTAASLRSLSPSNDDGQSDQGFPWTVQLFDCEIHLRVWCVQD